MITRLDVAASVNAATQTYSVSAGTDRMLVVDCSHEVSGLITVTGVDYGGQAMVQAEQISTADAGFAAGCSIWYLLDAGIEAASTSVITPTYSAAPTDQMIHAASYENVNQAGGASTLLTTATAETNEATPNPLIVDLTEEADGLVIAVHACGNAAAASWGADMTEQTDQSSASSHSSMADRLSTTNGNVDIEGTSSNQNRASSCSASFAVAAIQALELDTRTAKGVASSKASGSTLTISNVSLDAGSSLIVALGYNDVQGHPTSVRWGNRELRSRITRNPGGYDIAHSVWTVGNIKNSGTRNLVATWADNIVERAMVALELRGVRRIDVRQGNNDAIDTTTPTTGVTGAASTAYSSAFAFFVSEGPSSDTVTSGTIHDDGSAATANEGQRAGTVGAPPTSNVTVQEMYLGLTSSMASQSDLVVGTARKFISTVVLMEPVIVHVPYLARTKDAGGVVMWCDGEDESVVNGTTELHHDGTGTNLNAVTDSEHKAAVVSEGLATADDVIVLVDE